MKKIILFVLLITMQSFLAQTITRKYNSLQKQYEYFDASGYLIGYEKYNSFNKQWEYYNVREQEHRSRYDDMKYEGIDLSITGRILSQLQKNNDINTQYVQRQIDILTSEVRNSNISENDKITILNKFSNGPLKKINELKIDYGRNDSTNQVVEYLYSSMNLIIKNMSLEKSSSSSNNFEKYSGKYFTVNRITVYQGSTSNDDRILANSYIRFENEGIYFKKADGKINYRNLSKEKYNKIRGGYEYASNWGAIFIDENLKFVKFYSSSSPAGNNYTYYITK